MQIWIFIQYIVNFYGYKFVSMNIFPFFHIKVNIYILCVNNYLF